MEKKSMENSPFFLLLFISLLFLNISGQTDTITSTQSIRDGDTIVSSDGTFELGFFTPANSQNRYVGIWYKVTDGTPVWVANREAPLKNKSGVLKITQPAGVLALLDASNQTIWSTNSSGPAPKNPVAQLLGTGNLVVREADDDSPENFIWQSFDYPSNTLLAGMKLGKNLVTGLEMFLSSWKTPDDPSPGEYTYHCDITGYPQDLLRKGSKVVYRAGPWNGLHWSGAPNMVNNTMTTFGLVMNPDEVYYRYDLVNKSVISTLVVNSDGDTGRKTWVDKIHAWTNYHSTKADDCDTYGICGPYGTCNILDAPVCQCFGKFVPKHQGDWDSADWSAGCVREVGLNCSSDGFIKYSGVKLPDTNVSWYNRTMSLEECKDVCKRNCSCMAYTSLDVRNGGSGCLLWIGDLVDTRQLSENGQDIYVRMAYSALDSEDGSSGKRREILTVGLPLIIAGVFIVLGLGTVLYFRKRKEEDLPEHTNNVIPVHNNKRDPSGPTTNTDDLELPQFELFRITQATDSFSLNNKIGEGGFGPVYKGVLEGGQEIAVKRLSETSKQGLGEFKNEVICIAKLQHRNLVKLLGCCIQGQEAMLVYEYMPNKSLDLYIFDEERSGLLDWPKRFNIINGIARGLMYLHQDSRLRIIHRDLKASNVLLDIDMNPKISDFGMARSFGGDETGANTRRVVGTYGYMSPEYAVDGIFSVKSDVFSFGVLVLEIISGKKNRKFVHPDHHLNLLGHAWILHKENRSLELVDPKLVDSCHLGEVIRSIHVGLLCVQQSPEDRPNMSSVVWMLSNEGVLPEVKQPGFFTERSVVISGNQSSWSTHTPSTVNDMTITLLDAR
ncbi:PREDICTED: G-type lectin S-receptor-like serine/threonine-protein kinase At4g27290 isoform X2 [Ipomoea nil]|uniref:G-type lectin S-receptor-like serine/threonine-protein kinase At4g27290 isoform X2 n=1 Tax=Ipomoea nil TaxID=35883 RepID=UPI0009008F25|nr:PREDICTED: G-type lectin S-receptor-like serine/threonine-protein kinase At4g27290 isoform X2 [Ipomoea nil]